MQKKQTNPLQLVTRGSSFHLPFFSSPFNQSINQSHSFGYPADNWHPLSLSLLIVTAECCSMTAGIEGLGHSSTLRNPERSKRVSKQVRGSSSFPSHHISRLTLPFDQPLSLPLTSLFSAQFDSIQSIPSEPFHSFFHFPLLSDCCNRVGIPTFHSSHSNLSAIADIRAPLEPLHQRCCVDPQFDVTGQFI